MDLHTTVLIPAHNTELYIRNCLDSVLKQFNKNFDILVVNDGSTDSTKSIVESYLSRGVSLLDLKQRTGVTYATHIGILNAQGPIITVVDSDDTIFPISLSVGTIPFQDPSVGFAWTKFIRSTGKLGWSGPLPDTANLWQALMYRGWWRASHQRFFRKSAYMSSVQMNLKIDRSSDFQLAAVIALTGCKTVFVPEITYTYRISRTGSVTAEGSNKQKQAVTLFQMWVKDEIKRREINEPC